MFAGNPVLSIRRRRDSSGSDLLVRVRSCAPLFKIVLCNFYTCMFCCALQARPRTATHVLDETRDLSLCGSPAAMIQAVKSWELDLNMDAVCVSVCVCRARHIMNCISPLQVSSRDNSGPQSTDRRPPSRCVVARMAVTVCVVHGCDFHFAFDYAAGLLPLTFLL